MDDKAFFKDQIRKLEGMGCRVNRLPVEALFHHYQNKKSFLYSGKSKYLKGHWDRIRDNWEAAVAGGREDCLRIVSCEDTGSDHFASMVLWRSSMNGWLAQHLISTGWKPILTLSIMLYTQAGCLVDGVQSGQSWFQPKKKYPQSIFGTIVKSIGSKYAEVVPYTYFKFDKDQIPEQVRDVRVYPFQETDRDVVLPQILGMAGKVYAESEELAGGDIELEQLNRIYQSAGLSRKRRVWVAFTEDRPAPAGFAVAHRGPLGFNFSLLENHCDLFIDPSLMPRQWEAVARGLIHACADLYDDFELNWFPIAVPNPLADMVSSLGGDIIRQYNQSIWLTQGFPAWYRHVERIYHYSLRRDGKRKKRKAGMDRLSAG